MGAELASSRVERVYERCQDACVDVLIDGRHSGSGWFADAQGVVATVGHLFRSGKPPIEVEVMSRKHGRLEAVFVALDRGHDIALLRVKPVGGGFVHLRLARQAPSVGEELLQFGTPLFRTGLLQAGRLARPGTGFEYYADVEEYAEVAYLTAMMQGGTSGGPWVNARGEVVGIQSGVMSLDSKPTGVAFMAPAQPVRTLLETLRNSETPSIGLAVDETWQLDVSFLRKLPPRTEGLTVAQVRRGGPADKAGVRSQDVLMAADGARLRRVADMVRLVRAKRRGDSVLIELIRVGENGTKELRVTLDTAETALGKSSGEP